MIGIKRDDDKYYSMLITSIKKDERKRVKKGYTHPIETK